MKRKQFTQAQNKILSEIYRRLNKFHNGDLNTNLLYLGFPSEAKIIAEFNLIECYGKEIPRVLNWYKLTEKGKNFFWNYITKRKLDEDTNHKIFTGQYVKSFNINFTYPAVKVHRIEIIQALKNELRSNTNWSNESNEELLQLYKEYIVKDINTNIEIV